MWMAQRGYICKRHGAWYVRFREKVVENGKTNRKEKAIWLCSAKDYPKKSEVMALAAEQMAPGEPRDKNVRSRSQHCGLL
jgi:hypothetical protein